MSSLVPFLGLSGCEASHVCLKVCSSNTTCVVGSGSVGAGVVVDSTASVGNCGVVVDEVIGSVIGVEKSVCAAAG